MHKEVIGSYKWLKLAVVFTGNCMQPRYRTTSTCILTDNTPKRPRMRDTAKKIEVENNSKEIKGDRLLSDSDEISIWGQTKFIYLPHPCRPREHYISCFDRILSIMYRINISFRSISLLMYLLNTTFKLGTCSEFVLSQFFNTIETHPKYSSWSQIERAHTYKESGNLINRFNSVLQSRCNSIRKDSQSSWYPSFQSYLQSWYK